MAQLILFGASELSEQIIRVFRDKVHCCLVNDDYLKESTLLNRPVYGLQDWLDNRGEDPRDFLTVVCLGYNALAVKGRVVEELSAADFKFCDLHIEQDLSKSWVDETSDAGNIYFSDVGIEMGCDLGSHNIFWSRSHICHDVKIGSYNFFATGSILGGRSEVKNKCFVGFNSVVDSGVVLNDSVVLGANSFLKSEAKSNSTYLGNPAKIKSTGK